ncbi:MAG: hypothetical protein RSA29_14745 [Clostridium sp.]|uniref:hypothetical protein n=1 Tax=Clostridium sp. TaxID=1506 RepID=UPI003217C73E
MKKIIKLTGVVLAVILVSVLFLYFNNDIGISQSSIESDARKSQKIVKDWQVAKDTSDTMSAMIFYPEDKYDYTFSIYVNRLGISFGYFFRGGGNIAEVERYIVEFSIEGYNERAFISLNNQQVERLEINDGNSTQMIKIDSSKPFVFVLPKNIGSITFIDINGNAVETVSQLL